MLSAAPTQRQQGIAQARLLMRQAAMTNATLEQRRSLVAKARQAVTSALLAPTPERQP